MFVLSAAGKDRPGIAARVTRVLYETGCNIEDATMTILSGEFAIILMLSAPAGLELRQLDARFEPVRRELGLFVALRDLGPEPAAGGGEPPAQSYVVSVAGADHPGIVWRVTELLSRAGANVTDLDSRVVQSGASRIYMLVLEIVPARDSDIAELSSRLSELAAEIGVEVHVNPVETASL